MEIQYIKDVLDLFNFLYKKELQEASHYSNYHLEGDVYTHTMMVFKEAFKINDKILMIVALLHDLGKVEAREILEDGKVIFTGHEGISTIKSLGFLIKLLENNFITLKEMIEILYIINYHGILWRKGANTIKDMFSYEKYLFERVKLFYTFDRIGSISNEKDFSLLDISIEDKIDCEVNMDLPFVHILVGLPASGKDTFIMQHNLNRYPVLSGDDIIMELFSNGRTYEETYNSMTEEDHAIVREEFNNRLNRLFKLNQDFVVNATNLLYKSRKKFFQSRNYNYVCYVFLNEFNVLFERNFNRSGKYIPINVFLDMARRLELPLFGESKNLVCINFIINNSIVYQRLKENMEVFMHE